jgi:hypothetical protein
MWLIVYKRVSGAIKRRISFGRRTRTTLPERLLGESGARRIMKYKLSCGRLKDKRLKNHTQ